MEATGHYWKNLFAVLVATDHPVALLNPLRSRRFQDQDLPRTRTDAIDALGLARFAREKRPAPTRLGEAATEELKELVRHRDRLKQDFDDRVRQPHRLVDLGFPEFTRYVRALDSQLATVILADYPTAQALAVAAPHHLAKLRYDGRHKVGCELAHQLVEAARRSVGQHHGPAYRIQVRDICQDLVLWRQRLKARESDIERLLEVHEVGRLLTTIDGIGPLSAARIIAEVGDPARFATPAALAATVPDVSLFRTGRQFAAWLGLTPSAHSSGGRERQAGISKQGDSYIRRLLAVGATAVMRMARKNAAGRGWAMQLLERKRPKVVAPTLANKMATPSDFRPSRSWRSGSGTCSPVQSAARQGSLRSSSPASATKRRAGPSRAGWWPRSSGTRASSIPASASS